MLNQDRDEKAPYTALFDSQAPLFIGIRHHSAALARAIPTLLDRFGPETILLELPRDLNEWIPYLADNDTVAPVAVSVADSKGGLYFYPMADFSPELAAIRWGAEHQVPVVACDLPASVRFQIERNNSRRLHNGEEAVPDRIASRPPQRVLDEMMRRASVENTAQLWDRLVETHALDNDAEQVRRAAILFGWAVRHTDAITDNDNEYREASMREAIRDAPNHSVVLTGAFHIPALHRDFVAASSDEDRLRLEELRNRDDTAVSIVPYSFAQLDERSGYPAGIRDPLWHQAVYQSRQLNDIDDSCVEFASQICRRIRLQGHSAGTPDAMEVVRVARDLARLRRLPTVGRGEFIESLQLCLMQGENFGRGRAVARATEATLVGQRQGKVSRRVPQCGLMKFLVDLLDDLHLPGKDSENKKPRPLKLDVWRKPRDRARATLLRQFNAANIYYARRTDSIEVGARQNLIEQWVAQWEYSTSAMIASAGQFGVTLSQAVEAIVRRRLTTSDEQSDRPQQLVEQMRIAAECGIHSLVDRCWEELEGDFLCSANLSQLLAATTWVGQIQAGHMLGLPLSDEHAFPPIVHTYTPPSANATQVTLLNACLDRLEGLVGSDLFQDVAALVDLIYWVHRVRQVDQGTESEWRHDSVLLDVGFHRLLHWCRRVQQQGSSRMQGATCGVLAIVGDMDQQAFSAITSSWLDRAIDRDGRNHLRLGMAGAVHALMPLLQDDPTWLSGIEARLSRLPDGGFLQCLPALRGGFAEFSPADRRRVLLVMLDRLEDRSSNLSGFAGRSAIDSASLAAWRAADLAGQQAIRECFPRLLDSSVAKALAPRFDPDEPKDVSKDGLSDVGLPPGSISLADRWRLILGIDETQTPRIQRIAGTLDELYGRGHGEGSNDRAIGRRPNRGGTEAPEPTTIEWVQDLEQLFGADVCQEVLGEAASQGKTYAAAHLDPDAVRPSIELLQQVLSLAGDLPEDKLGRLRQVTRRITEQLTRELAIRLRPALSGLSTSRPTRRPTRKLDLKQTLRRNLANAYRRESGSRSIIPKRLIFNAPSRREMDWHLTFVVDVSGSMTTSTVYSAMVAAIFAGLPALTVRFLAFSTEVIELTEHVHDPLAVLLQVQIGGGTNIGLGLRAARAGLRQPSRSIVICVSDFEEGVSLGFMLGEIRALRDTGARCLGLAALNDHGEARFHQGNAQLAASAGMPIAAVSPENLARWIGEQIKGETSGRSTNHSVPEGTRIG